MAKDGKKGKSKKAAKAKGLAAEPRETTAKKRKKSGRTRVEAFRATLTRPATIAAAAGTAVVAGITGLWRARR